MKKLLWGTLLSVTVITGCATNGASVSDYAMGDDSAAIKAGRNRASAQISKAELAQHRRQRANVSEELDLEAKKRRHKHQEVRDNLGTAAGAVGVIGGTIGIFKALGF